MNLLRRKLPLQNLLPYVITAAVSFMAADLVTLYVRPFLLPNGAPPQKRQNFENPPFKSRGEYDAILARNMFNSDGLIPDVQVAGPSNDNSGIARESQLPLTLIGTIVHANPGKSVATIEPKGNVDKILPYIPNDDIEGIATLIKVERKKAFIRNLQSGNLEYIQIKDDVSFAFKTKSPGGEGMIKSEGQNVFAMNRGDLEAQMNNLPELLTQARAVPVLDPTDASKIKCFRIVDIVESSLFSKLGIKNGDCISGVDGERLDSAAKAMELYNALRSKSQVKLDVERGGQNATMTYNIR